MKWLFYRMYKNGKIVSIADFANMDIPVSRPNENGVFMERVNVGIATPQNMLLLVEIAHGEKGYYFGLIHETRTGGSMSPVSISKNVYDKKEDAFLAAIDRLKTYEKINPEYLTEAVHELFNSKHKQLELF